MSSRNGFIETHIYDYILANSLRDRDELKRLRQETQAMPMGGMQVSPDQGQFMGLLVELIGRQADRRGGDFYWLQQHCDGAGSARRRASNRLRRQRRVYQHRPALLAGSRRGRQNRIAVGAGSGDSRRNARGRGSRLLRHGLYRRRQGKLRRLLRALPTALAPGRIDPNRQRAVGRTARRCQRAGREHRSNPSTSTPKSTPTSA